MINPQELLTKGLLGIFHQMKDENIEITLCPDCNGQINIFDDKYALCLFMGCLICENCGSSGVSDDKMEHAKSLLKQIGYTRKV